MSPVPEDLKDAYIAVYEYAMLELGHPLTARWIGHEGMVVSGHNLPDDDAKFFVSGLARRALGLDVGHDRETWQLRTDDLNAAMRYGLDVGEAKQRTYTSGSFGVTTASFTFTIHDL